MNPNSSIREIWDSVSPGQAIKRTDYLHLCEYIHKETYRSLPEMANSINGFWEMNCEQAHQAVSNWVVKQKKLDPNFLAEYKENALKKYLE